MWKVTRKGLAAHKLRFVLTALAVILGVVVHVGHARAHRDDSEDVRRPVRQHQQAAPTPSVRAARGARAATSVRASARTFPASLARRRCSRRPAVAAADGNVAGPTRRSSTSNGKAIGGPNGPADVRASAGTRIRSSTSSTSSPGRPPRDRRRDRHRQEDRRQGQLQGRRPGDGPHRRRRRRSTRSSASRKFGTVDSLAGASIDAVHDAARRSASRTSIGPVRPDLGRRASRASRRRRSRHDIADRRSPPTAQTRYEVITGKALTKENQDAIHKALGFINIALLVFALVALIVGVFIIYNTFSIVVAQRTREMALLRAIGASAAPGARRR